VDVDPLVKGGAVGVAQLHGNSAGRFLVSRAGRPSGRSAASVTIWWWSGRRWRPARAAILSRTTAALRTAGVPPEEIDAYLAEATSGDYDHLLHTTMAWVDSQ
jgi:hypothetical protein